LELLGQRQKRAAYIKGTIYRANRDQNLTFDPTDLEFSFKGHQIPEIPLVLGELERKL